jgi:hypothetical protein
MGVIPKKQAAGCEPTAKKTRSAKHHTLIAARGQDNSLKKLAGKNGY